MIVIKLKKIFFQDSIVGMALFPFLLVKRGYENDLNTINHEKIHFRQQWELLIIPFYIWYAIEWMLKGYMNISFEKEAYVNGDNLDYLKTRKLYSFLKYFKK